MVRDTATPFTFETEFAADGTVLRDGEKWRLTFTREEMQAEADRAFERGRQDVLARAGEESAAQLRIIADNSAKILQTLEAESKSCRVQAMELVLIAARKIAGTALERYPEERVHDCVSALLADLRGQARLVVNCPKDVSEEHIQALHTMAEERGFEGTLLVRQDDAAEPGDVSLEWAQGEICVSTANIAERVEKTVHHWLAATENLEAQGNLFETTDSADEET